MKGRLFRTSIITLLGVTAWMVLHFNLKNEDVRLIMDLVMGFLIGWTTAAAWNS